MLNIEWNTTMQPNNVMGIPTSLVMKFQSLDRGYYPDIAVLSEEIMDGYISPAT